MKALDQLSEAFADTHPQDAARIIEQGNPTVTESYLTSISNDKASKILAECSPHIAVNMIQDVRPKQVSEWMTNMPSQRAVSFLRRLPQAKINEILSCLNETNRKPLERLLAYAPGTVGSALDPHAMTLDSQMTVSQALGRVGKSVDLDHHHLYVTDQNHILLGVLTLRDCMRSRPGDLLGSIMTSAPAKLSPRTRIEDVKHLVYWQDTQELPVVNRNGLFLGILRRETVRSSGADPDSPSQDIVMESAMALGELYWIGLTSMLGAIRVPNSLSKTSKTKRRNG